MPEAYEMQNESSPSPGSSRRETERLGDILRRVREHRGESINGIAQYLCIKPGYLIALEKSRYGDLPADAYVIGFLRSYANYLGLDEQGAIEQYRREMAGRRHKPQLSMPQPMTEGRTPTVALLVGGALAALLVYGIWYGLATPDPTTLDAPPPEVPIAAPHEKAKIEDIPPEKPEDSSVFLENAKLPEIKESPPLLIEAEPKGEMKENKKTPHAPAPPEETPPSAPQAASAPAETTPKIVEKLTPPPGTTFGETGKTRLVLRAAQESWILVTDEKGLTVFDKTLRPGDSYNVPVQKNLRLTTGNPQGLDISLDGLLLPKIQGEEKVARGIPLDTGKIRAFLSKKKASAKGSPAHD